jgi:alpha-beta hydrolase superfamily lysophospholipase
MREHQEGTFVGYQGLKLYYQSWQPPGKPRAILIIIHGLGGHSGLFGNIVEHFIPQGYAVYSFDLRGHGRSPLQRGHINSWAEYREDLRAFLAEVKEDNPDCPCFLFGHSLGAIIVFDYLLHYPEAVQGAIATAPAIGAVGVSPFKLALGRLLSGIYPRFSLSTGIPLEAGSRDTQVLLEYDCDPLRHTQGTARLATEFLHTIAWIHSQVGNWTVPLLILQGGADSISLPRESYSFFEQIPFPDKEWREYPGAYHELHNDLDYQKVLGDLEDWLGRHLHLIPI